MTEYQAISARRICLQATTLLCTCAAAWYQLALPPNSALACVAAGVLQGVSPMVRTPLGERSISNWVLDGVSLGLVAYGTRKLELAKRVKYLTGGTMLGPQLLISNACPRTSFGRVAAIDVDQNGAEAEVNALCDELIALKDQLTPQDLMRACRALFPKARPFSYDDFEHSVTLKLQHMQENAIEHLAGWEKAAAQMHFYELVNEHRIYLQQGVEISEEGLSPAEKDKRQEWLDTTGLWITQRWAICTLAKERLGGKWNALKVLIETPTCRLTFDQKIDLCEEYIKKAFRIKGGIEEYYWCDAACAFKEELIESLNGFEKCQAYMKHAEFYSYIGIQWPYLFSDIFPEIQPTLSPSETSQFQEWLDTTGLWITQRWAIWELETEEDLEEWWNALEAVIRSPTCRLTFDQKIDLWNEYITIANRLEGEIKEGSWCDRACVFKEELINGLDGFKKCQAYMKHAEFYSRIGIKCSYLFSDIFPEIQPTLSPSETSQFQEWLDTTGLWMTQHWAIWELETEEDLEGRWNALEALIRSPTCRLTFDQKIDLWNAYITTANQLEGGIKEGSWCDRACIFKEELINGLDGFEKCQAYMKHAEFYSYIGIKWSYLFSDIFPEIQPTLNPIEQCQFEKWMDEIGNAIRAHWEQRR